MKSFYNDNEPYVVKWLENLALIGLVSNGDVSGQSITDIEAWQLAGYTRAHFFAGIGGWDYALQLAGWPEYLPVWTGSCPCQPFSIAGKQKGTTDERHLWPYFRELIRQCKPPIIFGEQVASKMGREWLAGVRADLEAMGYAVGAADLCAAGVGAPHIRQRLYWMAHSSGAGLERRTEQSAWEERTSTERDRTVSRLAITRYESKRGLPIENNPCDTENQSGSCITFERSSNPFWSDFDVIDCADGKARRIESGTFPLAHGVPNRVGKLRAYGNAIVPQVAAEFIKTVMDVLSI